MLFYWMEWPSIRGEARGFYLTISNSNWTEWGTIQGVIARVISKSREADLKLQARLLPNLYDTKSNY